MQFAHQSESAKHSIVKSETLVRCSILSCEADALDFRLRCLDQILACSHVPKNRNRKSCTVFGFCDCKVLNFRTDNKPTEDHEPAKHVQWLVPGLAIFLNWNCLYSGISGFASGCDLAHTCVEGPVPA